jgi:DNA polymerase-3 subunit delta'
MLTQLPNQIPWLAAEVDRLEAQIEAGRLPHALLVSGPRGCGKRQLAVALASSVLHAPDLTPSELMFERDPQLPVGHPDLSVVCPPPDKHAIGIDQIRELTEFLTLTSHGGEAKTGLVCPANVMTRAAADSFLKTLEEPPGNVLLILVCDSLLSLPATIRSRCQHVRCTVPARSQAQDWLGEFDAGYDWSDALDYASGAPLLALKSVRDGFGDQHAQFQSDLDGLTAGKLAPVAVARRWARISSEVSLRWLIWRTCSRLRGMAEGTGHGDSKQESRLQTGNKAPSMRAYFAYLDRLLSLWRLRASGLNMELQIADLLTPWSTRFRNK